MVHHFIARRVARRAAIARGIGLGCGAMRMLKFEPFTGVMNPTVSA